jgi:hypothetical protein
MPDSKERKMKVAYIFQSDRVSDILTHMIIPQLEENRHGADVVGMFFFFDNNYLITKGNPLGERINTIAEKAKMLIMGCDLCCYKRDIADKLISQARIGCFPDLYAAIEKAGGLDQVITL